MRGTDRRRGFTLIELLVVIAIIAVLMGLAFPAFQGVQNSAKRTQAKNDLMQIVAALNSFYTEYGQYPCGAQTGGDAGDFFAADTDAQNALFDVLRGDPANGNVQNYNKRAIAFMQPPIAKDTSNPKGGIGGNGRYYDPWGSCYRIRLDNDYSGTVENPYTAGAGFNPVRHGIIAWSLGKDKGGATGATGAPDKNQSPAKDDVLSWQ